MSRRAADRLRAGHPWVYASDVIEIRGGENSDALPGLIPVSDQRGILLGTALYSPSSQIALRLISRNLLATDAEWLGLIESRLRRALALRSTMQTEACRLVFSEADELPGLIIDRYGALLLVQVLARGLQHETDHLDGVLFIDRMDTATRKQAMKAIREANWDGTLKITPHRMTDRIF